MAVRDRLGRLFEHPTGWTDGSTVIRASGEFAVGVERGVQSSHAFDAGTAIADWIRFSDLYRWLTAEPEPEVVVIDLRDTYTVGPFIAVIDTAVEFVADAGSNSASYRTVEAVTEIILDAPIRVASIAVLTAAVISLSMQFALGTGTEATAVFTVALASLCVLGLRNDTPWSAIRETRGFQLLAGVFEPPRPPEASESTAAGEGDDSTVQSDSEV